MDIKIGDKNKIKNSSIGHTIKQPGDILESSQKKSWLERHPVLLSLMTGAVTGFIFLFSFWKEVVNWMENLFG
ncbi:hypothetical protein B8V81_5077 [Paenibacillus pasadenensis]|uniref:Uncharacterized protein n=1 Tax=Paenibacillus pasadenensis TaxID=217090 RepID=A0A2N5MZM4_9BACL|nr:hypothetical protein [Paenibacillus pasadenensis]PLT43537.1 hypothetical protein B8V81_5077 [Paenibacillus pasadenensis]